MKTRETYILRKKYAGSTERKHEKHRRKEQTRGKSHVTVMDCEKAHRHTAGHVSAFLGFNGSVRQPRDLDTNVAVGREEGERRGHGHNDSVDASRVGNFFYSHKCQNRDKGGAWQEGNNFEIK